PDAGNGNPTVGQQITIGAGVPGLPAGTYTLLPSTYAMLPGAFRVELGGTNTQLSGATALTNGSLEIAGHLGIANTGIVKALPAQLIVTPGTTVRTYSQYNETSYSDFARAQAAQLGTPVPLLPVDAKWLTLGSGISLNSVPPLSVQGIVD